MTNMVEAYTVGKTWMIDYNGSRFALAMFLHGFDKTLDLEAITEITRALGIWADKPCDWF